MHDHLTVMLPRIPPALSSYISVPPEDSLTLLTHVLGAGNNWLILRYLYACLGDQRARGQAAFSEFESSHEAPQSNSDVAVVLVSWMRDFEFWKIEARRAVVRFSARLLQGRLGRMG